MSVRSRMGMLAAAALLLGSVPALLTPAASAAPTHRPTAAAASVARVLFDDSKAEQAGNADWVVSSSMPDPTAENASPSSETDWTGALSAWGVALQKTGRYNLSTLPPSGSITYGDSSNPQDLSNYDEFVLPEPNTAFSAVEKTAIMTFVQNGGGLFMISDHNGSDRNNDGIDSVGVLNDLMTTNSVDSSDPFGISVDVSDIGSENPDGIGASAAGDPIIAGPFGAVTGTIIRDGTTATLKPADDSDVRGEIYRSSSSTSGTTGVAFATSQFGSGRVAFWGDSSPMDDGTGASGNSLYNGWDDPAGSDAALALNATEWLAGATSGGGGGGDTPLANGDFESGSTGWTFTGGAAVSTAQHHAGAHSVALCGANNCAQSISQQVTVPADGSLTFWTYVITQETGTTAYDTVKAEVGGTVFATVSNAGPTGTWTKSTVSLASYAGQTVALSFVATEGTKLPTSFWVDDVTV